MKTEMINKTGHTPAFTSTRASWIGKFGEKHCNYTNFARADYDWKKLPKFLNDRFDKQDKTAINLYGCSDGSDTYTLIINMIKTLGDKAKKFFPILSSDIDPGIIKEAKHGKILLHRKDIDYLQQNDALKYFERNNQEDVQIMRGIEFFPYKVKSELRDKIDFSVKDVRKDVKENDFSDGVFLFRNGWGFNTLEEQNEIAKSLYENSNLKTIIGIGQSDLYKSGASDALQKNKFKGIETDVFTFAETDYPGIYVGTPQVKPQFKEYGFFEK